MFVPVNEMHWASCHEIHGHSVGCCGRHMLPVLSNEINCRTKRAKFYLCMAYMATVFTEFTVA